jgi:hypothetical protein
MEDTLLDNPFPPPFSTTDDFYASFNDPYPSQMHSILTDDNDEAILNSSSNSSETPTSPSTPIDSNLILPPPSPPLPLVPTQQTPQELLSFELPFSSTFVSESQAQESKQLVEAKPDPAAALAFETVHEFNSSKRTRKKRKLNDSTTHSVKSTPKNASKIQTNPNNLLKFSREDLSGLTSQEFEEYVRQLMAQRELTPAEIKELKRQRRLIKNRESAQASRQRKKNYVGTLEAQVASLANENANLKERITSLATENARLKEEVSFLNDLIKKTPGLSTLFNSGLQMLSSVGKVQNSKQTPPQLLSTNARAAGVVLLVLLFSFGLFLSPSQFPQEQSLMAPWSSPQPQLQGVNRILKGDSRFREASSSGDSPLSSLRNTHNFNSERLQRAFLWHRQFALSENSSQSSLSTTRLLDESRVTSVRPTEDEGVSSLVDGVRRNITPWKPNTTYLMCSDIRHVAPPDPLPRDGKSPMFLAFLIPLSSLSTSTDTTTTTANNNNLIEMMCQVIDINLLRFPSSSQVSSHRQQKKSPLMCVKSTRTKLHRAKARTTP